MESDTPGVTWLSVTILVRSPAVSYISHCPSLPNAVDRPGPQFQELPPTNLRVSAGEEALTVQGLRRNGRPRLIKLHLSPRFPFQSFIDRRPPPFAPL